MNKNSTKSGMTLVELLIAMSIGTALLAAVASTFIVILRFTMKNERLDAAVTISRQVQEHLNNQLSQAISQSSPVLIRPRFYESNNESPARYAQMTYRVPIGSFATTTATSAAGSNILSVSCPPDLVPKVGDYVLIDKPDLGEGVKIIAISGSAPNYMLTLEQTINQASRGPDRANNVEVSEKALVRIQRERQYVAVTPASPDQLTTELRWFESTASNEYLILTTELSASEYHMFSQVPEDPSPGTPAREVAIFWNFNYRTDTARKSELGGNSEFYQTNQVEGMIIPKTGDPLSTASILAIQWTTTPGSTTTAGTTTAGTTTAGTTTAGTTTKGTTTKGTTTKGTTTKGSTTTKGTTTAGTTTKGSTTTKGTTTKGTTTAGTTTKGTTTKAATTTKGSTTTKGTTTAGTTTKGTTTAGTTTKTATKLATTTIFFDG